MKVSYKLKKRRMLPKKKSKNSQILKLTLTLALGHSARPLFVRAASSGRLPHQGVSIVALVAHYRVVRTWCKYGFAVGRVLGGRALNCCNHNKHTHATTETAEQLTHTDIGTLGAHNCHSQLDWLKHNIITIW